MQLEARGCRPMAAWCLTACLALIWPTACRPDPTTDGDGDADADGDGDGDSDGDGDADADGSQDGDGDEECYEDIDIVFVVDVSTTMSYMLSTLEDEIGLVWNAAAAIDDNPHFGLVVFVDDVLVANEGEPYATVADIQADFHRWYTHTSSNMQTQSDASNTDWPENTLDGLWAAAAEYSWRSEVTTLRVIIHATDDTFLERPARFSSGEAAQHTYPEVIAALQERLIRVASFAAHIGGPMEDQDVEPGFFTDYEGQTSIPRSTSGDVYTIDDVGSTISLADAINGFVLEEVCEGYILE